MLESVAGAVVLGGGGRVFLAGLAGTVRLGLLVRVICAVVVGRGAFLTRRTLVADVFHDNLRLIHIRWWYGFCILVAGRETWRPSKGG